MPQQLSSKDASLFRQVVRHYENKQHKKGGFGIESEEDSELFPRSLNMVN